MLKQYVSKILLFTGLMTGLGGLTAAAPAWATVNPIWSGNVRLAMSAAKAAQDGLEAVSDDCHGLKRLKRSLLDLGAGKPAKKLAGRLGEIRMQLLSLEVTSSFMQLASSTSPDPDAKDSFMQVLGLRDEAFEMLEQKIGHCGNGVERAP